MSTQANRTSELPWDRRPVTSRDMVIFIGILVLACIGGVAMIAFSIRIQSGTAVTEVGDTAVAVVDQPAVTGSVTLGQELFAAKCTACYSIGEGVRVGPDLQGVTQQRDPDWLARWITEPDVMLAEGDPIATELLAKHNNVHMPNLQLTAEEVDNVIAYLANPDGTSAPTVVAYRCHAGC